MTILIKTNQEESRFHAFYLYMESLSKVALTYLSKEEAMPLYKLKDSFVAKTNDFYREDRKLNIGVIGQVKAGKSSFLNTLLFDGVDVLPRASTPKTATLTKIEYAEQNCIEIEYYTVDEWKVLEANALVESEQSEFVVAREIMSMVRKNGIQPEEYCFKRRERLEFATYAELMSALNDYVGENGKLTPVVKSVTLQMDKEELQDISVVDTPGLNDPIASRTDKTKQFIELCDVVFFLSRASGFLDKSDIALLTGQLPQKGVKRLVLICSRYDDGLTDTIADKGGIKEADVDTKVRLKRQAVQTFTKVIESYEQKETAADFIGIINECKKPVFVSAMAHNMSNKMQDGYSPEENVVYENLSLYEDVDQDMLRKIGNMSEVRSLFAEVVGEKDDTLARKAASFIPNAKQELHELLEMFKQLAEKRINLLTNNDKEQLLQQKKFMSGQINAIRSGVEMTFGELYVKLEQNKSEGVRELREASREYASLSEKTGTITHCKSYKVSTTELLKPSTWGTSRTEYYTYDERYYYLDVSDALENIRNFAMEATAGVEEMFYKSVDVANLKRKLLNLIIENFDASAENYDPAYFRLLAERMLNVIELPIVKMDASAYLQEITEGFSGEVTNAAEKGRLRSVLAEAISKLLEKILEQFIAELQKFKMDLEKIKNGFADQLLVDIQSEFDAMVRQLENKEAEIQKNKEFIEELKKCSA